MKKDFLILLASVLVSSCVSHFTATDVQHDFGIGHSASVVTVPDSVSLHQNSK